MTIDDPTAWDMWGVGHRSRREYSNASLSRHVRREWVIVVSLAEIVSEYNYELKEKFEDLLAKFKMQV